MRRSVRISLIVVAAVLVAAVAVALIVFFAAGSTPTASPHSSSSAGAQGTPSASPSAPASLAPSASTDPEPDPAPTDEVQPEPTPAGPATVTIVSWGADGQSVYASGIVTGDTGDDGTCTLTATSPSGQTLTARRAAAATPAAVNCGVIQISAPAGDWALVLSYQSETASAVSTPTEVTQP